MTRIALITAAMLAVIFVIGGLIDSTLMGQLVTPAVFFLCGRLFGPQNYFCDRSTALRASTLSPKTPGRSDPAPG